MLDVRRLRVLLAVAENGGIAAAARALSFTPPAVSQQLAALERQLGLALVDRTQRTARLTEAGQRLASHSRTVLAGLEAAEADLAALASPGRGITGTLRIATIATLGRTLLPNVLTGLAAIAPQVELRIDQMEPEDSLPALARGQLDLALAGEYALTPRAALSQLERVDLFTEPVYIVVPADHPAAGPRVHLTELSGARWIAPAPGSSCAVLLERSCALAGYEPHVVARCADFAVTAALVGAGHGVALLPSIAAPPSPDRGGPAVRLLEVTNPQIHRTLYAAVRRGSQHHPALTCLLRLLASPPPQQG